MREEARRKMTSGFALHVTHRALGVLCAGLLIVSPLSGGSRWAAPHVSAEVRPYNTALLVSADEGASVASIVTDGATLGWIDARGAIYVRTLADGRETRVLDGPGSRSQLVIGNGVLAWIERDQGSVTVRGLRLGGGATHSRSPPARQSATVRRSAAPRSSGAKRRAAPGKSSATTSARSGHSPSPRPRRRAAPSPSPIPPSPGKSSATVAGR